jgi:hypothetical protein
MIAMTFVVIETLTMIEALVIVIKTPIEKIELTHFELAKAPLC